MSEIIDIAILKQRLKLFAQERDWEQFHSPKNIASALSVEASELLEIFQWVSEEKSRKWKDDCSHISDIEDEIADVLLYLVRLCDQLDINLVESIERKIVKNAQKYPLGKQNIKPLKYI